MLPETACRWPAGWIALYAGLGLKMKEETTCCACTASRLPADLLLLLPALLARICGEEGWLYF